jgi:anti-sigma B factor antagonist
MAAELEIAERRAGAVTVLTLSGRLVADEADYLFKQHVDALIADARVNIVIDFRNVSSIDSGGVGTLVAKLLSARRAGGDLRLAKLTDRTRRVLEITRLVNVFHMFESVEAALHSYAAEVPRLTAGIAGPTWQ